MFLYSCYMYTSSIPLPLLPSPSFPLPIPSPSLPLPKTQELEVQLATLGDLVGVASMSQQHLLELGISPNATCMELVSKMASRFGELKQSVASRHVTIEKAMLRFECSAGMARKPCSCAFAYTQHTPELCVTIFMLSLVALPDGWHRAKTEKGTPYYIQ